VWVFSSRYPPLPYHKNISSPGRIVLLAFSQKPGVPPPTGRCLDNALCCVCGLTVPSSLKRALAKDPIPRLQAQSVLWIPCDSTYGAVRSPGYRVFTHAVVRFSQTIGQIQSLFLKIFVAKRPLPAPGMVEVPDFTPYVDLLCIQHIGLP
jgi:hypothetical protein